MRNTKPNTRMIIFTAFSMLLGIISAISSAQAQTFHFESICRSDSGANKNKVSVVLHDGDAGDPIPHATLAGVTVNALWTYVDYRQNHAVFKYRQVSCTTNQDGICIFNGGSGRARWNYMGVVDANGYSLDLSIPAYDDPGSVSCPDSSLILDDNQSIDFW